jgi:ABC-type transport system substrate-binding protein
MTVFARFASALSLVILAATGNLASVASAAGPASRSLHVGLPLMPDSLDPARSDTVLAWIVEAGIYDTLYALDPLARPAALVPLAASDLPEISADYRTITVRVRPGIFFTPHPAFGGKRRELGAADFAYSFKRVLDPKVRSAARFLVEGKIEGLDALAKRASQAGTGLDYDTPVSGLAVLDARTLRIRLNRPDPYFRFLFTNPVFGGIAREAVEAAGDTYGQRPAGTGAFLVEAFTPGQRLVLTRNPDFRELHWEDLLSPESRAKHATHAMHGKRLPDVDRLVFSSTPESSAELLALRQGQLDLIWLALPTLAIDDGKLKPDIAADGVRLVRDPMPILLTWFFSLRDPAVGGTSLEKIALRRAIAMAFDDADYNRAFNAGTSSVRHQFVPPGIDGFVPDYRNPNLFNLATANALLDRFGYKRGRDGYRSHPDGSALTVQLLTGTSSDSRRWSEFVKRMLDRLGVRVSVETLPPAERLKRMANCQFGMSTMDWSLDVPDGTNSMSMFWSKSIGNVNLSCYADAAFDAAYEQALVMPPGPARTALFRTMQMRIDAMTPARPLPVGDNLILKRSHVVGPFATVNDWLQLITLGIDAESKPAR